MRRRESRRSILRVDFPRAVHKGCRSPERLVQLVGRGIVESEQQDDVCHRAPVEPQRGLLGRGSHELALTRGEAANIKKRVSRTWWPSAMVTHMGVERSPSSLAMTCPWPSLKMAMLAYCAPRLSPTGTCGAGDPALELAADADADVDAELDDDVSAGEPGDEACCFACCFFLPIAQ